MSRCWKAWVSSLPFAALDCGGGHLAERTARQTRAIINGELDSAHSAVVAVWFDGGSLPCSGTIIDVKGSTGYAMTARHCVKAMGAPTRITEGNDYWVPGTEYIVEHYVTYSDLYVFVDIALMRFADAGVATPRIPVLSSAEDKLKVGDLLDLVGYGQSVLGEFCRYTD